MIRGGLAAGLRGGIALAAMTLSLASPVQAEDIRSVKIWQDSEKAKVYDDYQFAPGTDIQVYDFAIKRQTEKNINDALIARGVQYTNDADENLKIAQAAMGQFMQSDAFGQVEDDYKQLGMAMQMAFKYQVEKAPTIIFNERYRFVGIGSLKEVATIFHREVE